MISECTESMDHSYDDHDFINSVKHSVTPSENSDANMCDVSIPDSDDQYSEITND